MRERKKIEIVISVLIVLMIVGITVCLIIPAQTGTMLLIKTIVTFLCMIAMGVLLISLGVLFFIKKAKYVGRALIFGSLLFIVGTYGSYNVIRGFRAGPVEIEGENYELGHSYSRITKYYIIVTSKNQTRTKIEIDKDTYQYLENNTPDVQVSYYPYINIADKIIYR